MSKTGTIIAVVLAVLVIGGVVYYMTQSTAKPNTKTGT